MKDFFKSKGMKFIYFITIFIMFFMFVVCNEKQTHEVDQLILSPIKRVGRIENKDLFAFSTVYIFDNLKEAEEYREHLQKQMELEER